MNVTIQEIRLSDLRSWRVAKATRAPAIVVTIYSLPQNLSRKEKKGKLEEDNTW